MKFFKRHKNWVVYLLLSLFVVLGFGLRVFRLDKFNTITSDEETWIISGLSLLNSGQPESWTVFWETYEAMGEVYWKEVGDENRVLVKPYLDHPPVFQMLMGSWAALTQNNGDTVFNWWWLRLPMIGTALATITLTAVLARRLFDSVTAILSTVSFLVLPAHILAARVVAAEQLLALLLVGSLVLVQQYLDTKRQSSLGWELGVLIFITFMAILIKLSGIIIAITLGIIFLTQKQWYELVVTVVAALLGIATFIGYGCYYNCQLFWAVLEHHAARPQTFWYFFTLFGKPDLGYYELRDPMMVLGLIGVLVAIFMAFKKTELNRTCLFAPVFSLMILFVTIAPIELYGWYKFILFPFLAIGLGYIWNQVRQGQYQWWLLLIPAVLVLIENIFPIETASLVRKLLIVMLLLPVGAVFINQKFADTKTYRYLTWGQFLLVVTLQLLWSWQTLLTIDV